MLTNFYTIENITEQNGEYICVIRLDPAHDVYRGHFPGMPVTPGVCMLQMIKECVSRVLGCTMHYKTVVSCKFLSVVDPGKMEQLTLAFSLKDVNTLQAVVHTGDAVVLKLKATLIPRELY